MAYADFTGKIILNAYGKTQLVLAAASCKAGDLLTATAGLADNTSAPAVYVACEAGVLGDVIWVSLAAIAKRAPTPGTRADVYTRGSHGGTLGDAIYLGTTGGTANASGGSIAQLVGYVLEVDTILLCPMYYLTGVNIEASGTLTVGSTSSFANTITVTAGKFIVGSPQKMTITSKDNNATLGVAEAGIILVTVDNKTMTLPTAVGNAGLRYIIKQTAVHTSGTTIDGNGSQTIDGDLHPTCGAQYDFLDIVSNGANWDVIGMVGTWG